MNNKSLNDSTLTEQDLHLSFSRCEQFRAKIKNNNLFQQIKQKQNQSKVKQEQTDFNFSNDDDQSCFNSFRQSMLSHRKSKMKFESDQQKNQQTTNTSSTAIKQKCELNQSKCSLNLKNLSFANLDDEDQNFADSDQQGKQVVVNQEKVVAEIKNIDKELRELHLERNRLKYFLRKERNYKEVQGILEPETKDCPCCGKLISKLCFRCEHTKCKIQNCTRKKKQMLNARMLQKMKKENKSSKSKGRKESKKERKQMKKTNKEVTLSSDQYQQYQQSDSLSRVDEQSDDSVQIQKNIKIAKQSQRGKNIKTINIVKQQESSNEDSIFLSDNQ